MRISGKPAISQNQRAVHDLTIGLAFIVCAYAVVHPSNICPRKMAEIAAQKPNPTYVNAVYMRTTPVNRGLSA